LIAASPIDKCCCHTEIWDSFRQSSDVGVAKLRVGGDSKVFDVICPINVCMKNVSEVGLLRWSFSREVQILLSAFSVFDVTLMWETQELSVASEVAVLLFHLHDIMCGD
jgi:hypothetical protein